MLRIGIVATHPIQYQAPWFRALAARREVDLTIYYCLLPDSEQQGAGFGVDFQWDVPLLEGYRYEVLGNIAAHPGLGTFFGCDTPDIGPKLRTGLFDAVIILGWGVKSYLQALRSCRRSGTPAIARGESNAMRPRPIHMRLIHRVLLSQFSAFLTIGRSNEEFYRANGVPSRKLFGAPYCVDNERFGREADILEPQRNDLRAQWGISPTAYTFLFCAKFIDKKRPTDVLEALARALTEARPGSSPLHLLMVGDGELRRACEGRARDSRLPVSFTGFLNQARIAEAYVASDCLVLPSDYGETWGLVVNEAMACGRPAIVSDRVGCHLDLVRPETGSVFLFGDIDALAQDLARFASDPAASRDKGSQARKLIQQISVPRLVEATLRAARGLTPTAPTQTQTQC